MAVSSPAAGCGGSIASEARPSGSVYRGQRIWRWYERGPLPDGRGSVTGASVAGASVVDELVTGAFVADVLVAGVLDADELDADASVAGASVAGALDADASVAGVLVVASERPVTRSRRTQGGQAAVEYVVASAGVLLPITFMLVFTAQLLWTWHSGVEWTREGARYAATHCYQNGSDNVRAWMRSHVPIHMDQQEFSSGTAEIQINYYGRNAETGTLEAFACDGGDCSTECVPDAVTIRVTGYEYRTFMNYLGLPAVRMPNFMTSMPIESAGCDPEAGTCLP